MRRFIQFAAAAVLCLSLSVCGDDSPSGASLGIGMSLEDMTPLYKGVSDHFGSKSENIVLYATKIENLYYIHQFFGEDSGGLAFYWDRNTDKITLEESFSGLMGEGGPVFVLAQSKYLLCAGSDAEDSFYSPASGIFTFNVVMETTDALGQPVQFTTVLNFTVKSSV